jgi:hypothetical protein
MDILVEVDKFLQEDMPIKRRKKFQTNESTKTKTLLTDGAVGAAGFGGYP